MALLTKKLLTASLHSAGPLFGLATYLDTSAQLPWPGGQIVVQRITQLDISHQTVQFHQAAAPVPCKSNC